jgi:hypothetical protein
MCKCGMEDLDAKVHITDQLCHGLEEYPDIFVCSGRESHESRSASAFGVIDPSAPPNERLTDESVNGLFGSPYEMPDGVIDPL